MVESERVKERLFLFASDLFRLCGAGAHVADSELFRLFRAGAHIGDSPERSIDLFVFHIFKALEAAHVHVVTSDMFDHLNVRNIQTGRRVFHHLSAGQQSMNVQKD